MHSSGNYLISGDDECNVKIFDLRAGRISWTLYSHKAAVKSVAFNHAGDYFATTGMDSNCLVWKSNFDENMQSANVVHFADPNAQISEGTSLGYSNTTQVA